MPRGRYFQAHALNVGLLYTSKAQPSGGRRELSQFITYLITVSWHIRVQFCIAFKYIFAGGAAETQAWHIQTFARYKSQASNLTYKAVLQASTAARKTVQRHLNAQWPDALAGVISR